MIGFFFDPEETVEDQKEFELAANLLLKRTEIYFCMMTNQAEIKKAKKKYQEAWFEDFTLTGVVIQHAVGIYTISSYRPLHIWNVQNGDGNRHNLFDF